MKKNLTRGKLKDKAIRYADTLQFRSNHIYDHQSSKEGFYDGYMSSYGEGKKLLLGLIIGFIGGGLLVLIINYLHSI